MQLTRKQFHEQVYFYTLILIAISLPLSTYTTSMFQIALAVNWLLEGRFAEKWRRVVSSRALQMFLLFFFLHLAGMLWSDDLSYGLRILKINLPLLGLPVVIATSTPLDMSRIHRVLLLFSVAVLVASLASMFTLAGWLPGGIEGYRDMSLFISHSSLSLMLVLGLLVSVYFLLINRSPVWKVSRVWKAERIYHALVIIWFTLFLFVLKSLSGIVAAGLVAFLLLLRGLFEIRDPAFRFMAVVPLVMIPLFSILYVSHAVEKFYAFDEVVVEDLEAFTIEGNPYEHLTQQQEVENGHYVWLYVCEEELEREWNRMSTIGYHERISPDRSLRVTLIRFLSSRGLRKDAEGIKQLSEAEIRAIERGTANHIFLDRFRLYPRIYEVIWEFYRYKIGYPPNNKSAVQRYLYLQAGWSIAREHLLFGVGTGDVLREFKTYYEEVNSPLEDKQRRDAHNQYLTELIAFGIPGLLIFLAALVAPLFLARRQRSFLATGFLILLMASMLSAATLNSATGAALGALFYSLFLFGPDFPWLRQKSGEEDG
jgi:hypothetical protein